MSDSALMEMFKYGSLDKVVVCHPDALDGLRRALDDALPFGAVVEVVGDETMPLGSTLVSDRRHVGR